MRNKIWLWSDEYHLGKYGQIEEKFQNQKNGHMLWNNNGLPIEKNNELWIQGIFNSFNLNVTQSSLYV